MSMRLFCIYSIFIFVFLRALRGENFLDLPMKEKSHTEAQSHRGKKDKGIYFKLHTSPFTLQTSP